VCEAFGWESGFDNNWKSGKTFYILILISLIIPALIVLLPRAPLIKIMLMSQGVNGILLPIILIFVMKIINDKRIMGDHTNKPIGNIIAWLTVAGIIIATVILLGVVLFGGGVGM
jgi:Mn2+/Fe2+ NRAMP family transporter